MSSIVLFAHEWSQKIDVFWTLLRIHDDFDDRCLYTAEEELWTLALSMLKVHLLYYTSIILYIWTIFFSREDRFSTFWKSNTEQNIPFAWQSQWTVRCSVWRSVLTDAKKSSIEKCMPHKAKSKAHDWIDGTLNYMSSEAQVFFSKK